jgi:hypothetical protein
VGRASAYPSVDNQENHTFTKKSTASPLLVFVDFVEYNGDGFLHKFGKDYIFKA